MTYSVPTDRKQYLRFVGQAPLGADFPLNGKPMIEHLVHGGSCDAGGVQVITKDGKPKILKTSGTEVMLGSQLTKVCNALTINGKTFFHQAYSMRNTN